MLEPAVTGFSLEVNPVVRGVQDTAEQHTVPRKELLSMVAGRSICTTEGTAHSSPGGPDFLPLRGAFAERRERAPGARGLTEIRIDGLEEGK